MNAACRGEKRGASGILLATLVLTSCAVRPPLPEAPIAARTWPEERAALQALPKFELRGRVAVMSGSDGFNGSLRWSEERARAQVAIEGPLGAGGLNIELDGSALTLTTSRGERLDGEAARGELERRIGFALPLTSLRYWLLGAPDPGLPADETTSGLPRLDHLAQAGWQIDYPLYAATGGLWLPRRLTMQRGPARVRLVVDHWDR